ncbi:MAG: hypothetical protein A2381_08310 [Bdellovibrionales bacterium RIFOXYB1_FULL_37_110]|nr:MAG: hypothetical protein A2417_12150 [Bdellovibrionales bacterium RIFOXYC1_FULL_37_79]OFZ60083.1 MAG: hypothetical protein A2381_08310 [Bdellovibrionales bacterium RIFOXYB1_FULL_37_110]OFZ64921.1 MAG: hypothetical protein A2577_02070 [Bdellovibrionales bacterium RIFOXYD1_FULL_36_51]
MQYIPRTIQSDIEKALARGKSVMFLGPRQTGKTTLIEQLKPYRSISLISPSIRQKYEKNPSLLFGEIKAIKQKNPLICVDEIQKVPELLDVIQELCDKKIAQFIITGSSARKLKRASANLLPGRVVSLYLDPFSYSEYCDKSLDELLRFGSLPGIISSLDPDTDLQSYVETYLEEEVRAEALVRNVGNFARFLELAAIESGNAANFRGLSQDLGPSHTTIASYYQILEDCLILQKIEPFFKSKTRKRLIRSPRYFFFDLGVRNICAKEYGSVSLVEKGHLFEQFIGLELLRWARTKHGKVRIFFWSDPSGPEVDFVIETSDELIPIEVKFSKSPSKRDIKHLLTFMDEYPKAKRAFVIANNEHDILMDENVLAVSWKNFLLKQLDLLINKY